MARKIIEPHILEEIDESRVHLESGIFDKIGPVVIGCINQDALYHSGLMEVPKRRAELRRKKEEYRAVNVSLLNAWEYALSNYNRVLTHDLIVRTAGVIDPNVLSYRTDNVRISGRDSIMPVGSDKVNREMETLLSFVNGSDLHPVENASLVHMHLVRIHPFSDGNGRISRLMQNLVLFNEGYAPAHIDSAERDHYQHVLREALREFKEREAELGGFEQVLNSDLPLGSKEGVFFDYLGSKVNAAMGRVVDKVDRLPSYEISLEKLRSPGQIMTLKRILTSYMQHNNLIGQVRVLSRNGEGNHLLIKGKIDESSLDALLKKNYSNSYRISKK